MTTPTSYPGGPAHVTVLDRFEKLKREGWPPEEAVELLSNLHLSEHFYTPFGPLSLDLGLGPDGKLTAAVDRKETDPGAIPTREPDPVLDPPPVPLDPRWIRELRSRAQERAKAMLTTATINKPRTTEQYLIENPGALKGDKEAKAAERLAQRFTPDDGVTREAYRDEIMAEFKLSTVGYEERVWYAARYLAGLPRARRSGAPKGPRPSDNHKKPRKAVKK